MRRNILILCSAFLLIPACCTALLGSEITGAVEGTVRDAATGSPLPGVNVILISAKTETLAFRLSTDQKGHFYKSGLITGHYKITLEKDGYLPQEGSIRIALGQTTRLELRLGASALPGSVASAANQIVAEGRDLILRGKYDEAIARLGEAIAALPLNPIPYFYRGLASERAGKSDEALQDYQKAIELKPDFVLPHSRSGMIWARKADYNKAGEFYGRALEAGDQDPTTLYNYGVCLTNTGKSAEARPVFEKLLARDPEYSDGYYQLGILCLGSGETARAKGLLEIFIAKDPENPNAALAKEILKNLSE